MKSGAIKSAAADWSRWPAGTTFRILETGELYEVDDYGWALAGTNTIDLYKPSRAAMNHWGVRRVTIENLSWGDPQRSLAVLRPRTKYRHVRRMVEGFDDHYPSPPAIVQHAAPAIAAPAAVATSQPVSAPARRARRSRHFIAPPRVRRSISRIVHGSGPCWSECRLHTPNFYPYGQMFSVFDAAIRLKKLFEPDIPESLGTRGWARQATRPGVRRSGLLNKVEKLLEFA